jgi:ketosteroid isomerase-like protein
MSAAANKKLMQEIFAELQEGRSDLFVKSLADEVVMRVTGQYTWSNTFVGKQALLKDLYGYLGKLVERGGKTIPLRFIADEDYVVVEARGDMLTKKGERYDNEYCLVYRLAAGKIVEAREYCDSKLCEDRLGPFPKRES